MVIFYDTNHFLNFFLTCGLLLNFDLTFTSSRLSMTECSNQSCLLHDPSSQALATGMSSKQVV